MHIRALVLSRSRSMFVAVAVLVVSNRLATIQKTNRINVIRENENARIE